MIYTSQYLPLTAGAVHTGVNYIYALSLAAGADAATLTLHDGANASDYKMWKLSAPATGSATITFTTPIQVTRGIFVVLTGTTPLAYAAVDSAVLATKPSSSNSP